LSLFLPSSSVVAKTVSVKSAAGITVHLDDTSDCYEITAQKPAWTVGNLNFDKDSGRFSVEVSPAATIIPGQDPPQTAIVKFTDK
jgi:hypothetical protein